MGIRGLYTFINKVPGGFKNVNILDEVETYRQKNGEAPVIVINLWTMANHLKQEAGDVIVGYRLNKMEAKFEEFLQKLDEAGAEMIFTFKKTQTKESDFNTLQENEYKLALELINKLKMGGDFEGLKQNYQQKISKERHEFPYNHSVMLVLCQVADRYGKLYGLDTLNSRPSTSQVKLANDHNAIALMGLNTHYIFYSGSWAFWSDADLNMDTMTIRQYDRKKILEHLNVTIEKAALFSVLAGSLYSSEANVNKMAKFFRPWTKQLFPNVAKFVNEQRFPITEAALKSIVHQVMGQFTEELFDDFKRTLSLMDPKSCDKVPSSIDANVVSYIRDDYANLALEILDNFPFYISTVYLDLRHTDINIHDLALPFIQKTAGLLLKNRKDETPRTILVKKSSHEGFAEIKFKPVIPEFKVPCLETLISGDMNYEKKLVHLEFICGLKIDVDDLKSCPDEFVIDAIICAHLVKNKAMTIGEAQCLMKSVVETRRDEMPEESRFLGKISERAFRLSFLYQKLYFILHSCFAAAGLKIFHTILKFDGAHFQRLFAKQRFSNDDFSIEMKALFAILAKIAMKGRKTEITADDIANAVNSLTFTVTPSLEKYREKIDQLYSALNFQECLKQLDQALIIDETCAGFLCLKAECLVMLERYEDAKKIIRRLLKENPLNLNALYVQGLKDYYEVKMSRCIVKLNAALKIHPEFEKAKDRRDMAMKLSDALEKGKAHIIGNKNSEAIEIFTSSLNADPSNKNFIFLMLFNRGISYDKLQQLKKAFDDFSDALKIKETSTAALYRRAIFHYKQKEFGDCIIDCEASLKEEDSEDSKKLIELAKTSLKMAPNRNCYEILGIQTSSTSSEIKKTYRKLSLQFHPDKAPCDSTDVEKKKFARKFREVKEAHDVAMAKCKA